MKKQYQTNYTKLNKILNLSKLKKTNNTKTIKNYNGYTTTIARLSTSNSYYYIATITSIDTKTNSYREFVVRIWENELAQIIRFKEAYFSDFEEVYVCKNGLELAKPAMQYEANKSFEHLLDSLTEHA